MNLWRRLFFAKAAMLGGFNPFGSWEDFQSTVNRAGWAWQNLLGQDKLLTLRGGQIKFPSTQISSSNVNTLDDYEEGTWTPTLQFGGGSTGLTYASQVGAYTKIGRTVFLRCTITLNTKGSSTGGAAVASLPFNSSSSGGAATASIWWNNMTSSLVNTTALFSANSSTIVLYGLTAGATSISQLTEADFADNTITVFSITYDTAT